jgi:predicted phosphodiesterase
MSAIAADVLGISGARRYVAHEVAGDHANYRVTNHRHRLLVLEKRVAAVAGVLDKPVTHRDAVHPVTEQTAEIADFLLELSIRGVGIAVRREYERVSTLDADILVMLVAIGHAHVRMVAEKAGQGMANAGE